MNPQTFLSTLVCVSLSSLSNLHSLTQLVSASQKIPCSRHIPDPPHLLDKISPTPPPVHSVNQTLVIFPNSAETPTPLCIGAFPELCILKGAISAL